MSVAIITNVYPDEYGNMKGIFVHNQAKAIKQYKDVIVLFLDFRSVRRKRPVGLTKYKYEGVRVYRYSLPTGPIYSFIYKMTPFLIHKLYKCVKKTGDSIDLVHAHFWRAGIAAMYLKSKYKIPYVITEHGSDILNHEMSDIEQNIAMNVYKSANAIVAVSSALAKKMKKIAPEIDINIIPNVVPMYMYDDNHITHDVFRFISVGNLVRSKRFDLTINAFIELKKKYDTVELYIVGGGPLERELKELSKNQLNRSIFFLGKMNNKELARKYSEMDCLVLPSDFETFGVTYIEANARGLPVIATKCGGPEEIVIPGENGELINVDDLLQLTEAMERIFNNNDKYDSYVISNVSKSKYGEKAIGKKIVEVYEGMI